MKVVVFDKQCIFLGFTAMNSITVCIDGKRGYLRFRKSTFFFDVPEWIQGIKDIVL